MKTIIATLLLFALLGCGGNIFQPESVQAAQITQKQIASSVQSQPISNFNAQIYRTILRHYVVTENARQCVLAFQATPEECAPGAFYSDDGYKISFAFQVHNSFPINSGGQPVGQTEDLIFWKANIVNSRGDSICALLQDIDVYDTATGHVLQDQINISESCPN